MAPTELTPKQQVLLKLVRGYIADHGYPPTVRELCRLAGLKSPDTVQYHLDNLRAKGLLEASEGKSRALAVAGHGRVALVPILGRVPAGPAVGTYADAEGHVPVSAEGQDVDSMFALRVKGDSMEPTLMDRDTIVVRWQPSARTGDIVVARLDEEDVTVKRLKFRPSGALLVPDNTKYAPFPLGEGKIAGKVVSLIRRL
ncbi:MAG: repressor LexA [Elusimicrobia bacterium]|nr:repressor LexA [Elusimicrobiota bacterium]